VNAPEPILAVRDLVKTYQALRPLRIQALTLNRGDVVSLGGLDAPAAEMLVSMLTGAMLPDSGEIQLFGQSTRALTDTDAWLAMLDGVGIVTDRAVLISQFSVEQNMAMPFSLAVDPVAPELRSRVAQLAGEVGLATTDLPLAVAQIGPERQARVRLARALALNPAIVLMEHPSATLPRDTVKAFAADVRRVARTRNLAVLAVSADDAFVSGLGGQFLTLEPATGALKPASKWHRLFGR
jgi:ABC-type lipoprotein export system ATPase subunit